MLSKSFLDELRDRLSIVTVIGERVPLKKAGRYFKGCCPFHAEKTPSFMVSDEKRIFHCFGCGEGGDVIAFIMKFDGLPFVEAVRLAADRAGLSMPQTAMVHSTEEVVREEKRKRLLEINQLARDYFVARLQDPITGAPARTYLQSRGIAPEISTQHFLGYADNAWDALVKHMKGAGVSLSLAAELGLIRQREDGSAYDFFRQRLIFPILSPRGEVLAFGGRTLANDESAKYLNSADSSIYHKSNCVYGISAAAAAIRKLDGVVVVEGYMDVLAVVQAGIANTVAPLGTALTEGHVRLLMRYTRNMVLAFDGDNAGASAQVRALPLFIAAGLVPRAVTLPAGDDPDTFVRREGGAAFQKLVANAPTLFERFIDWAVGKATPDSAGKVAVMKEIIPLLKQVSDPVEQSLYRRHVARRLGIDESVVQASLTQSGALARDRIVPPASASRKEIVIPSAERTLIETVLRHPELASQLFAETKVEDFSDDWCRTVAGLMVSQLMGTEPCSLQQWLESIDDTELRHGLRAIALTDDGLEGGELTALVRDCQERIKRRPLTERLERLNADIRAAEAAGDEQKVLALLVDKRELAGQLKHSPSV